MARSACGPVDKKMATGTKDWRQRVYKSTLDIFRHLDCLCDQIYQHPLG